MNMQKNEAPGAVNLEPQQIGPLNNTTKIIPAKQRVTNLFGFETPVDTQPRESTPILEHVLKLAAVGRVFPIQPDTKLPALKEWPDRATTDPATLREWFGKGGPFEHCQAGICPGKDFIVVDVDNKPDGSGFNSLAELQAQGLPKTYTVKTPSGGLHLYYKKPKDGFVVSRVGWMPGIDIRGDRGQVVAPGSTFNGKTYETLFDMDMSTCPADIYEGVPRKNGTVSQFAQSLISSVPEGVEPSPYEKMPPVVAAGGRDGVIYGFACSWRTRGYPMEMATILMRELHSKCEQPPGDEFTYDDCILKLERAYAQYDAKKTFVPEVPDGKPAVVIGGYLDEKSDELIDAFIQSYKGAPKIYRRGDQLVWLNTEGDNSKIIDHTQDSLRGEIARQVRIQKQTRTGTAPTDPPLKYIRNILATPNPSGVQKIIGIIHSPVVRPDGSILFEPGYDKKTKLYHKKALDLRIRNVPELPTGKDVKKAAAIIQEPFCDFWFVDQASKTNILGFMLTGIAKPIITGNIALSWVKARQAGSGKTLIAQILSNVNTGYDCESQTLPKSNEELRKKITASLMAGSSFIMYDNVSIPVDHPVLSAALTSSVWQDRILGRSELATCPQNAIFMINGNNPKAGGDIARRCAPSGLDPKTSRPEARTGFKHPNIIQWVRDNRGEIIWSILVLIRAWIVAGKPKDPDLPVMGSFENWSETIGGILYNAGIEGFLRNLDSFRDEADEEAEQWAAFLSALHDTIKSDATIAGLTASQITDKITYRGTPFSAEQTTQIILPDLLAEAKEQRSDSFTRVLGKALKSKKETRFLLREGNNRKFDIYLKEAGKDHNSILWSVVKEATS